MEPHTDRGRLTAVAQERTTLRSQPGRMLFLWITAAVVMSAAVASAAEDKGRKVDVDEKILKAVDVQKYLSPYVSDIGACYQKHALDQKKATGDLKIELIIHRDGSVFRAKFRAPGVNGNALEKCLLKLTETWHFPPRAGFTHVVVPFFYLKTTVKGAGPLESCWSAKGCPKKRRQQRAAVRGETSGSKSEPSKPKQKKSSDAQKESGKKEAK